MAYASALRGPENTYRRIDVAGRAAAAGDGAGLVQMLYGEVTAALRAAAHAAEQRNYARKSERVTRATAVLFALEAGLDHEAGGEVSRTLATLYAGARREVVQASLGDDPAPFRTVAAELDGIAQAWATVRAR
ncbi:flagellar export chaperone FliS [uncultured Sphingomonas sp.]|uniref:flagellar export chaperone FliS n=1 Tax=uncultured Sphingomonas sp. TaxID=158754 RepID=UPI0035CB754A